MQWSCTDGCFPATLTSLGALFAHGVGYYHDPYYAKVLYVWGKLVALSLQARELTFATATVSTSLTFGKTRVGPSRVNHEGLTPLSKASSFIMSGIITSQLAASKGELTIVGHKTTGIRRQIAIVIESLAPATIAALVNLITFFTHVRCAVAYSLLRIGRC